MKSPQYPYLEVHLSTDHQRDCHVHIYFSKGERACVKLDCTKSNIRSIIDPEIQSCVTVFEKYAKTEMGLIRIESLTYIGGGWIWSQGSVERKIPFTDQNKKDLVLYYHRLCRYYELEDLCCTLY